MAPIRKRTTMRSRAAKTPRDAVSHPRSTFTPPAHIANSLKPKPDGYVEYDEDAAWRTSKKDKRAMKHSVLMNKVRDAGVRKAKPRRPNKKLKTDLESLADALPELDEMAEEGEEDDEDEWEGLSDEEEGMAVDGAPKRRRRVRKAAAGQGKMEMKSLKHKPGAMKRKRAMEGREMDRFGKNLAQLVGSVKKGADFKAGGVGSANSSKGTSGVTAGSSAQADRWAALRNFIGGSMEQNKAFTKT
ncbi:hypothetical protein WHR41_09499 [Cladosporium halotolerans]|uniref:Ribosome biogenesis protein SLX9 n=1 Tax=Cladosporium halotolerans TaxID=1052096 RepID=A0AB34KBQ5_9PEZI